MCLICSIELKNIFTDIITEYISRRSKLVGKICLRAYMNLNNEADDRTGVDDNRLSSSKDGYRKLLWNADVSDCDNKDSTKQINRYPD